MIVLIQSPITVLSKYSMLEYMDGNMVPVCRTAINSYWTTVFFVMIISVFFLFPLGVLIVLYAVIAQHLMADPGTSSSGEGCNQRARKQVVLMLGTVVLSFFLCLLPIRVFILWIIIVPEEFIDQLGIERYYILLYFCRIMLYLNSAINPILYNLMSSKFRIGFRRLVGLRRGGRNPLLTRDRPTLTTTLSHSSSRFRGSPDFSSRRTSLDSRHRNGSIRRNVTDQLSSLLLREHAPAKPRPDPPQNPESYV